MMSPPPYPSSSPPTGTSRSYNVTARPVSGANGFPLKMSSTNGEGPGPQAHKPYPHVSDLQANAVKNLSIDHSLNSLLTEAHRALTSADSLLSFRRPDLAYQDYLRAFEIVANIIPRHPEHPTLATRRATSYQNHTDLLKRVASKTEQYAKIKDIIVNDNQRNGTLPFAASSSSSPTSRRQSLNAHDQANRSIQAAGAVDPRPNHNLNDRNGRSNGISAEYPSSSSSGGAEALNDRFARLRMGSSSNEPLPRFSQPASGPSTSSQPPPSPSHNQPPYASFDSLIRTASSNSFSNQQFRPAGPRPMPNGSYAPSLPSVDTQSATATMPKAPSPTYSPARNMQVSGHFELPRSTARSMVGTGGRSNSARSSASPYAPGNEADDAGYFPRQSAEFVRAIPPPRRKSVHLPKEVRIGPEKLYDYLKMHSILLIDLRPREDFDDGHIYAQSIICIEPTALRPDMSAEDLQDALVLSPEVEQNIFLNRNKYDLVVYYDQATTSDRFLSRPSTEREYKLRFLYDALYEYNQDKPLQRPPILLMGGIEAWTDLVGDQALMRSTTSTKAKAAKAIRRVPVATDSARLYVPKKRLREYNPLDADEERKWLERARVESVVVEQKSPMDEDDESRQVEDATPFYNTIEEFNRRFPDAGRVEQRPVMDTPSLTPSTQPRIFSYPTPPPPTQSPTPSVPSRPPPAMSRMSYSGVSDRAVSQNTGSSDLPAYVPPRYLPANLRLPRTGLVNFGVTCYMNATIQALSATAPLTLFFLDDRFKQHIQRDNWKGSKGVLPELYANLVRSIWKGDVEAIRPTTLRSFCARLNSEWGINRQQDAKEFFDFLVDCLHEDLNENWARTPLKALTAQQEEIREKMPKTIVSKTEWGRYTHRELSYLTSLFGGQHASRLRCTTCQFTSTTFEAFYSISVEIPRSGRTTIQDCLKSYCAEEMLSGDEVWKCPRCNKEREATKQITITRAPQFLVVHFKRFSAGRGESARKVRTPIEFPIRNLNLEPYMLASPSETDLSIMKKQFPADQVKPEPAMTPPYLYDAYAVMRHIGTTLTSGHYTCLAKDRARNCWRQFNDTWVADFDPDRLPERDRLQNEMAYIIFYQRMT